MTDDDLHRRSLSSAPRLSAEEIAQRSFSSARRGVSEPEVRSYLRRVADEVGITREQLQERTARIAELEEQLRNPPAPTEEQLLVALGAETARVLRSAQEAAEEIRTHAAERAEKLLDDAGEEAAATRSAAEEAAEQRTREAGEAAERCTREADEAAAEVRASAERDAVAVRESAAAEAEAEIEAARDKGREMLAEARAVRERVLSDLGRRKAGIQAQVEELRAGRDRLLEAYRVVQRTLVETTEALAAVEAAGPSGRASTRPAPAGPAEPTVAEEPTATEPTAAEEPTDGAAAVFARLRAGTDGPGADAPGADGPGADAPGADAPGAGPADADAAGGPGRAGADGAAEETGVTDVTDVTEVTDVTDAAGEAEQAGEAGEAGGPNPDDAHEGRFRHRDTALAPLHRNLARRAKRMLQDEQNSLLDRLRTSGAAAGAEAVLPSLSDALTAWSELVRPAVDQAFAGGRASVADRPVVEPVAAPDDVVAAAAASLVDPLRDRLEAALSAAVADDDADDAPGRVNARYREWKRQELDGRVGDLLAAAWSRGVFEAVAPGEPLYWVPEETGRCPDCDDNSLQPTPRGEPFPTGQTVPPAHPGCRCLLVPADPAVAAAGPSLATTTPKGSG